MWTIDIRVVSVQVNGQGVETYACTILFCVDRARTVLRTTIWGQDIRQPFQLDIEH